MKKNFKNLWFGFWVTIDSSMCYLDPRFCCVGRYWFYPLPISYAFFQLEILIYDPAQQKAMGRSVSTSYFFVLVVFACSLCINILCACLWCMNILCACLFCIINILLAFLLGINILPPRADTQQRQCVPAVGYIVPIQTYWKANVNRFVLHK